MAHLTSQKLADAFGVSRRTIVRVWQLPGCPEAGAYGSRAAFLLAFAQFAAARPRAARGFLEYLSRHGDHPDRGDAGWHATCEQSDLDRAGALLADIEKSVLVAVLRSGPHITEADCELLRRLRACAMDILLGVVQHVTQPSVASQWWPSPCRFRPAAALALRERLVDTVVERAQQAGILSSHLTEGQRRLVTGARQEPLLPHMLEILSGMPTQLAQQARPGPHQSSSPGGPAGGNGGVVP